MKDLIEEMEERQKDYQEDYNLTGEPKWKYLVEECEFVLEKLKALQNSKHDKTN